MLVMLDGLVPTDVGWDSSSAGCQFFYGFPLPRPKELGGPGDRQKLTKEAGTTLMNRNRSWNRGGASTRQG